MTVKLEVVTLQDTIQLPSQREITDSGQMIVPVAFARTGMQQYTAASLGLTDRDPNDIVDVHRMEADVFDETSMKSFRSVPLTIGHPAKDGKPIQVTSANAGKLQKGMLEGMPTRDEDTLCGTIVVTDEDAINLIDEGVEELSAGYTCVLVEDSEGRICQTNIRANHIAIVPRGRAGSSCRIADEELEMPEKKKVAAKKVEVEVVDEAVVAIKLELVDAEAKLVTSEARCDVLQAKLDVSDAALVAAKEVGAAHVVALVDTILSAKSLHEADYTGLTVDEVRRKVVGELLSVDVAGKSDAYVEARFDVLMEDDETPMSRELKKNAVALVSVDDAYVDPVEAARQKSIAASK